MWIDHAEAVLCYSVSTALGTSRRVITYCRGV